MDKIINYFFDLRYEEEREMLKEYKKLFKTFFPIFIVIYTAYFIYLIFG